MHSTVVSPHERVLVLLVRHGSTQLNVGAPRLRAWDDLPLEDKGELEAQLAGSKLRAHEPKIIYADDLIRTSKTSQIISKTLGNIPVECDFNLRTADMGQLTDMLEEEARPFVLRWYQHPWEEPPGGGDTLNGFSARFLPAFDSKLEIARSCPAFCPTIVVTHGRDIALLHARYHHLPEWKAEMPLTGGIALVKSRPGKDDAFEFLTPTEPIFSDK